MDKKQKFQFPQRKTSVHGLHYLENNFSTENREKTANILPEANTESENICNEQEFQYHILNDNFLMIGSPMLYPICAHEHLSYLPISKNKMSIQALPSYQKLPLKTLKDDEYIYVNSKQYYRILNRREKRKKMNYTPYDKKYGDKQVTHFISFHFNSPINKKKYLHESRHMHAINRERGKGGRFVGKKKPCTEQSHKAEADLNVENEKRGALVVTQMKQEHNVDDFFQVNI